MRRKNEKKEEYLSGQETPDAKWIREGRENLRLSCKMTHPKKNKHALITMNNLEVSVIEVNEEGKQRQVFKEKIHWNVCIYIYSRWKRKYVLAGYECPEPIAVEKPKRKRKKKGDEDVEG